MSGLFQHQHKQNVETTYNHNSSYFLVSSAIIYVLKFSYLITNLSESLRYGINQSNNSVEEFVHGYLLPWKLGSHEIATNVKMDFNHAL